VQHRALRQEVTLSHSILETSVQILHVFSRSFPATRWTHGRCGYNLSSLLVTSRCCRCVSSPKSNRRSVSQLGSSSRNPRVIQITVRRRELDQIALIGSAQADPKGSEEVWIRGE
jgi:hypothetical protein